MVPPEGCMVIALTKEYHSQAMKVINMAKNHPSDDAIGGDGCGPERMKHYARRESNPQGADEPLDRRFPLPREGLFESFFPGYV